jgi:hypothetical protein
LDTYAESRVTLSVGSALALPDFSQQLVAAPFRASHRSHLKCVHETAMGSR